MEKEILGEFDGENMVAEDGRVYPVSSNYASKSKLVEGDCLKLNITSEGEFIYKQIDPVPRKTVIGMCVFDGPNFYVETEDRKRYKVIKASINFHQPKDGEEAVIILPAFGDSTWAAMESIIRVKAYEPESR